MLEEIEKMREVPRRKLSAQPNNGLPRQVDGRMFYMASPEYMAKYAKRMIQAGVNFIGGCCGGTPPRNKKNFQFFCRPSPTPGGRAPFVSGGKPPGRSTT